VVRMWRCNWRGKKQSVGALDKAARGEYEFRAFGWPVRFPVHTCCPDHDSNMRSYFAFCERWVYPFNVGSLALMAVTIVGVTVNSMVTAGLAAAGLGLLVLFFPLVRNTVKPDPDTKHRFTRWLGDLLLRHATPGDVLVCWGTGIRLARVVGAVLFGSGLLVAFGVLK